MPHVPYLPSATRFFARISKFEMECPSCGRIILSNFDQRKTPLHLQRITDRRMHAKEQPRAPLIRHLIWNPYTQRLRCPFCDKTFTLGIMAYEHAHTGGPFNTTPPEDSQPTRRQLLELRQAAGGWWTEAAYKPGNPINVTVDHPCICLQLRWNAECPVHGDPTRKPLQPWLEPEPAGEPAAAEVAAEVATPGVEGLKTDLLGAKSST